MTKISTKRARFVLVRRTFLAGAAATGIAPRAFAQAALSPAGLKRGEFVWQPERAPEGPVLLIVSIPEQLVHVYRGGIEIGVSTCSTGKPGHRTPSGIFTILEKQRQHVSSIYKGAQMPNMERLTWGGIALHAGNLPGYPASHGCVRLPMKFSALLFEVTHLGCAVIVADENTQPADMVHPGVMMPRIAETEARAVVSEVGARKSHAIWHTVVQYPLASAVISRADGMAHIFRDGRLQASYPVGFVDKAKPLGTHAYSLVGATADGSGLAWLSFGLGKKKSEAHVMRWAGDQAMRRVRFYDPARAEAIARTFHPGTMLLLTDAPAGRFTRTTPDGFAVVASEHDA